MLGRSVGITSLCALVANALILPPGVASSSDHSLSLSIVDPKSRLIQIPCPSCAFSSSEERVEDNEGNDEMFWIQGGANNIVLDFTVSDDGERLELFGEAIYPPQLHRNALLRGQHIYVQQVAAQLSEVDIRSGKVNSIPLEVTSSGWKTESEVPASQDGDVIIPMKFQILGLQGQPMQLDEIEIHLLKTGDGELLILRLERHASSTFLPLPLRPHFESLRPPFEFDESDISECNMLPAPICRFKQMLAEKIQALRHGHSERPGPCPGIAGGAHHLPTHIRPHHGRPHHVRPYYEDDEHHKHPALHSFARSVIAVLIPVMAGISVGLLVSLLGLLVGRLIGFVWITLARGGRRGSAYVPRYDVTAEEGKMLLCEDELEPLPAYEDAPAYVETEKRPMRL